MKTKILIQIFQQGTRETEHDFAVRISTSLNKLIGWNVRTIQFNHIHDGLQVCNVSLESN